MTGCASASQSPAAGSPTPVSESANGAAAALTPLQRDAATFLSGYEHRYQTLYTANQEAQWTSNTHIVEGDSGNAIRTRRAGEEVAAFVGSSENVARIRSLLAQQSSLQPIQVRQLDAMLYQAGDQPQTAKAVVSRRIAAEAAQVEKLYGFRFTLNGAPITPNQIDTKLSTSTDLAERRAVWVSSKEVGKVLRPGLLELRDLRNQTVRALGYPNYFAYRVSEYGMSDGEMMTLLDSLLTQLRPLYRELHTWARYELAKRYKQPVPEMIPADWLPNRWGQSWADLVHVEGIDVDSVVATHTPEWVVRQGERFYESLGFDSLPASFWQKSSLYAVPADAPYKKNTHASAWHIDLDKDVRSLMSVEANSEWYGVVHHELGHVYYYMTYSRPDVPLVLRSGANRAYHEGIGSMMQLAAGQRRFLVGRGLAPANAHVDQMAQMLKEALNLVVFIPWSAGTMSHFEHDLYAGGLPADRLNARWWELVQKYQGVAPPSPRGEEYTDAASKTHITDDPAAYYDYALSNVLLVQLHQHIATQILHQDPHDTDYFGNRAVGDFLRDLMKTGAAKPWRDVLRETTGRSLDAQAMVEYFQPLYEWLKQQNAGRTATLPDL
jgi:peptidyl-dipeptidase A